jgi:hypothetical protein
MKRGRGGSSRDHISILADHSVKNRHNINVSYGEKTNSIKSSSMFTGLTLPNDK